jgi:hypothetical protein
VDPCQQREERQAQRESDSNQTGRLSRRHGEETSATRRGIKSESRSGGSQAGGRMGKRHLKPGTTRGCGECRGEITAALEFEGVGKPSKLSTLKRPANNLQRYICLLTNLSGRWVVHFQFPGMSMDQVSEYFIRIPRPMCSYLPPPTPKSPRQGPRCVVRPGFDRTILS